MTPSSPRGFFLGRPTHWGHTFLSVAQRGVTQLFAGGEPLYRSRCGSLLMRWLAACSQINDRTMLAYLETNSSANLGCLFSRVDEIGEHEHVAGEPRHAGAGRRRTVSAKNITR